VPAGDVDVGDVILMRQSGVPAVLHRVVERHEESGHYLVETKGDANASADPGDFVLPDEVLVATLYVPKLGYVFKWAHTPPGWLVLQVIPSALVAAWIILPLWFDDEWRARRRLRLQHA
jgi:signal peptidase I